MKIATIGDQKRTATTSFLKDLLLKDKFSPDVATWFCENIELIDDQSMKLIEYLKYVGNANTDEIIDDPLIINCLLISSVVVIGVNDASGFIEGVKSISTVDSFVQLLKRKIFLD
jgi:hypothetical protein